MPDGLRHGRISPGALRSAVAAMLSQPPAESWRDTAACIGADYRLFIEGEDFGEDGGIYTTGRIHARRAAAFEYCDRCPVITECLDEAIATRDIGVIRGGLAFPLTWRGMPPPRGLSTRRNRLPEKPMSPAARDAKNARARARRSIRTPDERRALAAQTRAWRQRQKEDDARARDQRPTPPEERPQAR